jgi:hypothetical protein
MRGWGKQNRRNRFIFACLLFLCFSIYFVFSTGWYEKSVLEVGGTVEEKFASVRVEWDSGAGYNHYEQRDFQLKTYKPKADGSYELIIRRIGEKNPASLSADVYISSISIDNKNIDLFALAERNKLAFSEGVIRFTEEKNELRLQVAPSSAISTVARVNNHSGYVEISFGNEVVRWDLYAPNETGTTISDNRWILNEDGRFSLYMMMPRYTFRQLRVTGESEHGTVVFAKAVRRDPDGSKTVLWQRSNAESDELILAGERLLKKRYINPGQLLQQLLFAALTTWAVMALWHVIKRVGGWKSIWQGRRKVFWSLFTGAAVIYSFWLAAFFPGVASIDSLKVWRAAMLPDVYLGDHPFMNVLFYKYLYHIWANMGVVPVVQVVVMSFLLAYVFYRFYLFGAPLAIIALFYAMAVLSVPIGMYNVVLWKDIPFAILSMIAALIVVDWYCARRAGRSFWDVHKAVFFLLVLICLATIRHNGVVYFVVIPVLMLLLGLVKPPRYVWLGVVSLVFFIVCGAWWFGLFDQDIYFITQGTAYARGFLTKSILHNVSNAFSNYWGVFDINQGVSKWDLFHYFLGDRTAYRFLLTTGWHDVYGYVGKEIPVWQNSLRHGALFIYYTSNQTPWVYLSWNALQTLVIFPTAILCFRWAPLSAIFSLIILSQVFVLLFVIDVMNWRYYYFFYLGGMFIVPLLFVDIGYWKRNQNVKAFL